LQVDLLLAQLHCCGDEKYSFELDLLSLFLDFKNSTGEKLVDLC
jgi:hypothetical protein